ncbi:MAG: hypothetical protein Q9208_003143 [Pyrenodesmia sp. 3 TL-2023]
MPRPAIKSRNPHVPFQDRRANGYQAPKSFRNGALPSGPPSTSGAKNLAAIRQRWTSSYKYPILYWFPSQSDADEVEISTGFGGARLQAWHVLRAYMWYGGDFRILGSLFTETFTKDGIRQNWIPCGRAAVVWDEDTSQRLFVTMGNVVLCGDIGPRTGLEWRLPRPPKTEAGSLTLRGGVPQDIGNAIPTEENLRGVQNTYVKGPVALNVSGVAVDGKWSPPLHPATISPKDVQPKRQRQRQAQPLPTPPVPTRTNNEVEESDVLEQTVTSTRLVRVDALELKVDRDSREDASRGLDEHQES